MANGRISNMWCKHFRFLTNIPHKVKDVCLFDDIFKTDEKLIDFNLSFIINKKRPVKRIVYNWRKAEIRGLKQSILLHHWSLSQ